MSGPAVSEVSCLYYGQIPPRLALYAHYAQSAHPVTVWLPSLAYVKCTPPHSLWNSALDTITT